MYIDGEMSNAPFVRFGVQVGDITGTSPVSIRLSVTVTPNRGGGAIELAYEEPVANLDTDDSKRIGPVFSTVNMSRLNLAAAATGLQATGKSITVKLYTGPTLNDNDWVAIPSSAITLTENGTVSDLINEVDMVTVSAFAQLWCTANNSTEGTLDVIATVHTNC